MKQKTHTTKIECLCEVKFSSTVQQHEPTPAPIDNLHKLLMPEDAAQLQAVSACESPKHDCLHHTLSSQAVFM